MLKWVTVDIVQNALIVGLLVWVGHLHFVIGRVIIDLYGKKKQK